jgi:predicted enzyme related to lactoylglutathione lyase
MTGSGIEVAKIGLVQVGTNDIGRLAKFYQAAFGLTEAFRDGERYVGLSAGAVTFALASRAEAMDANGSVPAFKVSDVGDTLELVRRAGGMVLRGPEQGPHEIRAVVRDPDGNAVIVYGRK